MYTYNKDLLYQPRNIFIWFLLAFQGGLLNVGGFLAVHRFVSHVTGFATLFGVHAVTFDWLKAFGMLLGPGFFLLGTMISAWFIERNRLLEKAPRYSIVFIILISIMFLLSVLGSLGFLGNFGEEFSFDRDYSVLLLLSLVCGLQNAVISSASGAMVRTTHLTGPTTDLGIGLIKLWTERRKKNKELIFATYLRVGIILSFIAGSFFGAFAFNYLKFLGFLIPAAISIFVMFRLDTD